MCAVLAIKYAFLYAPTTQRYLNACVGRLQCVQVNVIYKVDVRNRNHNYPPLNNPNRNVNSTNDHQSSSAVNEDTFIIDNVTCSTPVRVRGDVPSESPDGNCSTSTSNSSLPHRTYSHYGYNCPLTNAPNILLHPANQSIWLSVAEQRDRVVSFIDLTALTFSKRKMLNVFSGSCGASSPIEKPNPDPETHSYVSSMNIQLEPRRKERTNTMNSCQRSANDSIDELSSLFSSKMALHTPIRSQAEGETHANDSLDMLTAQFSSKMTLNSPSPMLAQPEPTVRDDDSLYPSSYVSRNFLPDNHALSKDSESGADKPEAEQIIYQNGNDSGLGLGNSRGAGRRQRLVTTSNESSTQEAEAYTQGKHIRLTLSSSPEVESQLKSSSIEILINVSLRNSETCILQAVPTHELDFRSKLEKVIDDEIHYISQQLVMQNRNAPVLHSSVQHPRAPLDTPTCSSSPLLQRSNSAPALCHTYSYVALDGPQAPPSTPTSSRHCATEPDELQRLLSSLELELQHLLNSIIRAHALHNRAVIYECRTRISQMREDISVVVNRARAK